MARRDLGTPAAFDFAGEIVQIESEKLARRHGLDPERVHRTMRRTATDAYGRPLQPPAPGRDNLEHGLQFHPSLDEALAYLPPEDALSAFERADPIALSRRASLVPYLGDPTSPSYTVGELADLLDAFGRHLERNRDPLVRTGYPQTGFAPSPWLEWHLTLLSPTKVPVGAFGPPPDPTAPADHAQESLPLHRVMLLHEKGLLPSDADGNLVYSYSWAREAAPLVWSKDGPFLVRSLEHPVPPERCPYEEAAFIDGLAPEIARQLGDGRAKLFQLKRDVIATCARCLRSRDADALWPGVLHALADALLWSDAQRYLDVEALFWRAGIGECVVPSYWFRAPRDVPGTLSALLTVVGHVEKELRFGTFDRTMATAEIVRSRTGLSGIESYFQVVGHPAQAAVDAALDGFWALEEQEGTFREEFRHRVNAALEAEFRDEVVVRVPVKRGLVATFEPYLRTFAEWQRAQLEATGTLAPLHLSSPSEAPAPRPNVFRRDGQVWTIEYDGQLVRLRDAKGLRYLAILLAKPNREFHVLDLVRRVAGTPADQHRPQDASDREEMADLNPSGWGFGDAGDEIDDQTRADLRRRLQELPGEIDEKLELGDVDGADRLRAEREGILAYLAGTLGLGGRPRAAASTVDKARSAVTKRINDARQRIGEHHPALGRHLRSVGTGTYCRYAPDSLVDWEV